MNFYHTTLGRTTQKGDWLHGSSKMIDPNRGAESYGPETLRVIAQAFDKAWAVIGPGINPDETDQARTMLADAILQVATEDSRDPEAIKNAALLAMMEVE
jgi:hypothetical protein